MLSPEPLGDSVVITHERESNICLLELMQIVMLGVFPSENGIESLLDRIEGLS